MLVPENGNVTESAKAAKLHERAEENRFEFLKTDLAICFTYLDLAKLEFEADHWELAQQAITKTEEAYAVMRQFLGQLETVERRNEIDQGLNELPPRWTASLRNLRKDGSRPAWLFAFIPDRTGSIQIHCLHTRHA